MAGHTVRKGQTIFNLVALPNDASGLGAQQEVAVRRKQLEAAQAQVNRYQQLRQEQSTSQRLLQESEVALRNAQAAFNAAQSRQRFLVGTTTRSDMPQLSTLGLKAPLTGVVQKIFVTPNQLVSAGTPLFEVSSLNPVWVRVPVYAGDLSSVSNSQTAMVRPLGESQDAEARTARFVPGPPTANPQAISTDLFFELPNQDNAFQVGQKVSVTLSQRGDQSGLTIPFSAIAYDIDGGTWLYLRTAPHTYARKRVVVSRVVKGMAVLARGLDPDAEIVTVGVPELFGTEFGAGK
jgi:cobalt-zinc-cadmium efflux system membrane fusion protein